MEIRLLLAARKDPRSGKAEVASSPRRADLASARPQKPLRPAKARPRAVRRSSQALTATQSQGPAELPTEGSYFGPIAPEEIPGTDAGARLLRHTKLAKARSREARRNS